MERMDKQEQIAVIEKIVNGVLEATPEFFLVQVKIKPTNNIKVFLDGDNGITIENCIKVNRKLYADLEEMEMYPDDDFSLEVSSPGVGEPLLLHRQYVKNIGRLLEVKLTDDSILLGILKAATDDEISVEVTTGKGKKAETVVHSIQLSQIKEASVQIKF
jgi:ribosome maturation factor RimP